MAVILKPMNDKAGHSQKPVYNFGVYLTEVFLPLAGGSGKSQLE